MKEFKIVEVKGDITFLEDDRGILYQKLGTDVPYKVRNGSITYKHITRVNGYDIKYNNNGIYGFSIFKGNRNLEDGFWVYDEVLKAAMTM